MPVTKEASSEARKGRRGRFRRGAADAAEGHAGGEAGFFGGAVVHAAQSMGVSGRAGAEAGTRRPWAP
ncbi:MAG: hypothetical protein U0841_19985 [Chloroflexia bacterium]